MQTIPKRFEKLDTFFELVSQKLNISLVNPLNITEEKEQFFASKCKKNPQFVYEAMNDDVIALKGMLEEVQFGKTPLEQIYSRKKKDLLTKITLLENLGTKRFFTASKKSYTLPNESLVKKAYTILAQKTKIQQTHILRKDAVKLLRTVFKATDLHYKIRGANLATSALIHCHDKILYLQKRERFSHDYLKRLIVHEIGVHAFRYANGEEQPLRIFKHSFANYLETEEGLAAYNEYCCGLMAPSILRNYAARVVAVHFAATHDFVETYTHMRQFYGKNMAWKLTLRAKRGLCDTSEHGGFTKDVVYFRGFLKIYTYAKRHSIKPLYIGKIGLADLKDVSALAFVKEPTYFPTFELFSSLIDISDLSNKEKIDALLKK